MTSAEIEKEKCVEAVLKFARENFGAPRTIMSEVKFLLLVLECHQAGVKSNEL